MRHGEYQGDHITFTEAEATIRRLIKDAREAEAKRVALNVYVSGGIPSAEEKASYELDAYRWVRSLVYELSVPAAVYQGANQ